MYVAEATIRTIRDTDSWSVIEYHEASPFNGAGGSPIYWLDISTNKWVVIGVHCGTYLNTEIQYGCALTKKSIQWITKELALMTVRACPLPKATIEYFYKNTKDQLERHKHDRPIEKG